jgi:fatty-acyl-CoA synthase
MRAGEAPPPARLVTADRAPAESDAPTLVALLRRAAAHARGETHGLRFLDRRERATFLSWREVAARAGRVAASLVARGIRPGERVAIVHPTGPGFFDAFLGTLLAGAVPAPLYPPFRLGAMAEYERRTAAMIAASSARLVLADRAVRRLIGGVAARARAPLGEACVEELLEGVSAAATPLPEPADLALVQFSSGTTGGPRPVALDHAAILHQGRLLNSHWPDSAELEQAGVSWLPLYHDMGLIGCVVPAMMRPATLTLLGPELFLARPALWLRAISRYRATISPAPNFAYALAAERIRDEELEGVDLSTWRAALNGAETVSGPVLRAFAQRFSRFGLRPEALTPVYGLAEAALAVTFSPLDRPFRSARFDRRRLGEGEAFALVEPAGREAAAGAEPCGAPAPVVEIVSVGRPVPGFEVEVRPENEAESDAEDGAAASTLPEGRIGRILVRGPSLMSGYLDQPEATACALRDGWLDTGDRGFVLDGELWIAGRVKDVLVLHGRNHDPDPLERAVGAVAGVRTGCVVAASHLPVDGAVEELLVLAELRRGAGADPEARAAIESECRRRTLADTGLRIDRLVLLEPGVLPRTSSGKLRRGEALERFRRGEIVAAGDEGALARLAREVGSRPTVQAARALVRSARLRRAAGGDAGEEGPG